MAMRNIQPNSSNGDLSSDGPMDNQSQIEAIRSKTKMALAAMSLAEAVLGTIGKAIDLEKAKVEWANKMMIAEKELVKSRVELEKSYVELSKDKISAETAMAAKQLMEKQIDLVSDTIRILQKQVLELSLGPARDAAMQDLLRATEALTQIKVK